MLDFMTLIGALFFIGGLLTFLFGTENGRVSGSACVVFLLMAGVVTIILRLGIYGLTSL